MIHSFKHIIRVGFIGALLLSSPTLLFAQKAKVNSKIDRKEIRIGEQIKYEISVEADSTDVIHFPEGQTFTPLEMVTASAIDTFRQQERYRLIKKYCLTQFDSGAYTIPAQKVHVGNQFFSTDSISVKVNSVKVDTLKQPMYSIKPMINVPNPSHKDYKWYFILIIGALLIIGFVIYWFFLRKKPLTEEEKMKLLPPFERAILELKNLQNSRYLIESKHKEYYSILTDIVREYLEEEVHVSAMESTTDELLNKIQLLQDSGKLHLSAETIDNLHRVLKNADLVKFAKSQPSDSTAEDDRYAIEQVVVNTKETLPEPTPEEIKENELYLQQMKAKKAQRRKTITIISVVVGICILLLLSISYLGLGYVKDKILGNTSRELVEGDWITSDYGYPITELSTPKVLKRRLIQLPKSENNPITSLQTFEYGSILGGVHIVTSIISLKADTEVKPEMIVGNALKELEKSGVKNIITKQEEYTTAKGVKGIKIYGSLDAPTSSKKDDFIKKNYNLYNFSENGAIQQLLIIYDAKDTFGKEIAERVIQSINFKIE